MKLKVTFLEVVTSLAITKNPSVRITHFSNQFITDILLLLCSLYSLKEWPTYYKFQSFFYPNISCPQHHFIDKFLNFLVNKLNIDIVSKIHSKIKHPFKVFWELKFRIQLSKMVFAKLVGAMYVHVCYAHLGHECFCKQTSHKYPSIKHGVILVINIWTHPVKTECTRKKHLKNYNSSNVLVLPQQDRIQKVKPKRIFCK